MAHAGQVELEAAGVEIAGSRQDGLLEAQLLGFLEARRACDRPA